MSWIKSALQMTLPLIVTMIAVDAIAYLGFREKIQTVLPGYGLNITNFDRGYPRYHFRADDELGFDINANFQTTTSTKPAEYITYDVWGNSFGCFDDEWSTEDQQGGVYIAGDSFMWGYVSYDKKAATLLQDLIEMPVYECGVTHTGQRHQFEKFKQNFQQGIKPSIVVVNISWNDINNDFFFPHTTVVEGYMVETVEQCGNHTDNTYSFNKISNEEAESVVSEALHATTTARSTFRTYSLTANVLVRLIEAIPSSQRVADNTSGAAQVDCQMWLYGGIYETLGPEYLQSDLSLPNREAITQWIQHASNNGYEIVFSLIPAKSTDTVTYPFIRTFIEAMGPTVIDFDVFVGEAGLEKNMLYYETDEHLNETGNKHYAAFLGSAITEILAQ